MPNWHVNPYYMSKSNPTHSTTNHQLEKLPSHILGQKSLIVCLCVVHVFDTAIQCNCFANGCTAVCEGVCRMAWLAGFRRSTSPPKGLDMCLLVCVLLQKSTAAANPHRWLSKRQHIRLVSCSRHQPGSYISAVTTSRHQHQ
jgi:hypothetical protein